MIPYSLISVFVASTVICTVVALPASRLALCSRECGVNEFYEVYKLCEESCAGNHICLKDCRPPGCKCRHGYVRYETKCIEPSQCVAAVASTKPSVARTYKSKPTSTSRLKVKTSAGYELDLGKTVVVAFGHKRSRDFQDFP